MVKFVAGMQLELWVRDTGAFDGFAVFVNGSIVRKIGDQEKHVFPISTPASPLSIAVNFGGQDGGASAIVNVAKPDEPVSLETQSGINHGYIITP